MGFQVASDHQDGSQVSPTGYQIVEGQPCLYLILLLLLASLVIIKMFFQR
eukprot:m.344175 g.344175  ORF g.344175 m.344175 type:complete len:50 (+) comp23920_c0_seq1:720-869(+)